MPNAIELLKKDHSAVRKLLKDLTETTNRAEKTRLDLLSKIKSELQVHTQIEEEIFYPAFRNADQKEHGELYHEAMEEHRIVEKMVIPDTESSQATSDEFAGRAKVLMELVEHHAKDEEKEMFPMARKVLSAKQLEDLGARMEARKKELQKH